MIKNMLFVAMITIVFSLSFVNIKVASQTNKAEQLKKLINNQPNFRATMISSVSDFAKVDKITHKDGLYLLEIIYHPSHLDSYSERLIYASSGKTIIINDQVKTYTLTELSEKIILRVGFQMVGIDILAVDYYLKKKSPKLETVGVVDIDSHKCTKVKATVDKRKTIFSEELTYYLYFAQDLDNLIIKVDTEDEGLVYQFEKISLDNSNITADMFTIPVGYSKISNKFGVFYKD